MGNYKHFIFTSLLVLLLVVCGTSAHASKKVRLNCTKKTIYVNETATIKLLNNKKSAKWSTSNKNIKIISKSKKSAKIKAVKEGTSYLKVKVEKKTYKCKITTKKERLAEETTEKATENTIEKKEEVTTEKATEKTIEKTTEKTIEKTTEKTTEKESEKKEEKTAEKTNEKDKSNQYTIVNQEINTYTTDSNPEPTFFIGFELMKNNEYKTCDGNCKIVFINSDGKTVYEKDYTFDDESFSDYEYVESGKTGVSCTIDFDIKESEDKLIGKGKIGFIVTLSNGQEFPIFTEDHYFTKTAKSGEKITIGDVSIIMPQFQEIYRYRNGQKVAGLTVDGIEYGYNDYGNGIYTVEFWIVGKKTFDATGEKGTSQCGMQYNITHGKEYVPLYHRFTDPVIVENTVIHTVDDHIIGDRFSTYPYACNLTSGEYYLNIYDYKTSN